MSDGLPLDLIEHTIIAKSQKAKVFLLSIKESAHPRADRSGNGPCI